jgi:hypothetical protein
MTNDEAADLLLGLPDRELARRQLLRAFDAILRAYDDGQNVVKEIKADSRIFGLVMCTYTFTFTPVRDK